MVPPFRIDVVALSNAVLFARVHALKHFLPRDAYGDNAPPMALLPVHHPRNDATG